MALTITNIDELRNYKNQIEKTKISYDEKIDELTNTIKSTALYWQGEDGEVFRTNLYSLIDNDLKCLSKEMSAELEYLKKLIIVLESAQEDLMGRRNQYE